MNNKRFGSTNTHWTELQQLDAANKISRCIFYLYAHSMLHKLDTVWEKLTDGLSEEGGVKETWIMQRILDEDDVSGADKNLTNLFDRLRLEEDRLNEVQSTSMTYTHFRTVSILKHKNEAAAKLEVNMSKSSAYTPQQNGRIERGMRTTVEAAGTVIHSRSLNENLWGEVICCVHN
ncbi:unnamed protein product [Arctia plantaginis]|uniref:Integrase catalytic domain-containing protein n=1 Tax=Arctia plantaginis TaxID=874455 RepID=A0A8S0Z4N3_ARCPL|nr:unnamed protein product [Arctia plantaginis]